MAYKVFEDGQPLTGDDLNLLMEQVTPIFASAVERDVYIPMPKRGRFCYVVGTGQQMYTGGTWRTIETEAMTEVEPGTLLGTIPIYADTESRDGAIAAPATGQFCYVIGSGEQMYASGAWRTVITEAAEGEEGPASLVGTIPIYVDVSARDAAIADPVIGQFAYVLGVGQQMYSGETWRTIEPETVPPPGEVSLLGTIPVFSDVEGRDLAIPTPATGQFCYITGIGQQMYAGGAWRTVETEVEGEGGGPVSLVGTVPIYADAATRDAAIAAPTVGQLCYVLGAGVQLYAGGAWRTVEPETVVASSLVGTVPIFANATARDAAIVAPATGQLCYVLGVGMQLGVGGAWRTIEPETVAASSLVGTIPIYANTGARDSAIATPVTGQFVYVAGTGQQLYAGAAWRTITPETPTVASTVGTIPIYASTGARDAAITAPTTGQFCYVAGVGEQLYAGGAWRTIEPEVAPAGAGPTVYLRHSCYDTNQSFSANSWTRVKLDNPIASHASWIAQAQSPGTLFNCQQAGRYVISASFRIGGTTAGSRGILLGHGTSYNSDVCAIAQDYHNSASEPWAATISGERTFGSGDSVALYVYCAGSGTFMATDISGLRAFINIRSVN